jgi:Protein kinase domain
MQCSTVLRLVCAQTLTVTHCYCYYYCCCCSATAAATIIQQFRIRVAKEGLEALEYLHLQELIHRDIKSSNFLLDSEWKCKLSDFGMARQVAKDGKMTICGTVSCSRYAAKRTIVITSALRTRTACTSVATAAVALAVASAVVDATAHMAQLLAVATSAAVDV